MADQTFPLPVPTRFDPYQGQDGYDITECRERLEALAPDGDGYGCDVVVPIEFVTQLLVWVESYQRA